jgi:SulP family sulfate permease
VSAAADPKQVSRVRGLVPIADWGRRYERSWLRGDVVAGVTVSALVVPKALGYAGIAGVPIENGLYAAMAGAVLYALFGTSRQISTGPSSALAAVAGSAVIVAGVASGSADATALVAGVALAAGGLFLLMAIFKLGWGDRLRELILTSRQLRVGADHIHATVDEAVETQMSEGRAGSRGEATVVRA